MKSYTCLLALALLLPACANWSIPKLPAKPTVGASLKERQLPSEGAQTKDAAAATYPKLRLTPELLFGVLASEIAAQRGGAASSAVTYLELGSKTRDVRLAQRAAEFALFAGQLPIARDALQLWVATDPAAVGAREQLSLTLLRLGKIADSGKLIKEVLLQEPTRAPALFVQLARLSANQSDKAATYDMVTQLAALYPTLPEAQFAITVAAAAAKREAAMTKAFDRLASLAPTWDFPVAWHVDRLSQQHPKAAQAFLGKELARRPNAGLELRMAYPKLLLIQKDYAAARLAFEELNAHYPRHPDLLYACGLLAYQLKDLATAKKELQAALDEHHTNPDMIRLTLAQIAEDEQQEAVARHWYQQIPQGSQYMPAQVRLAYLDAATGKLDQAVARLDGLGATKEDGVQIALLQSQLARDAKRYKLAYTLLGKALQRYPNTPELLYERAIVSDMRGNVSATERDLRQFLKEKPDDPVGLNALGYTLANRTHRYRQALALVERALKASPDSPLILDSMGWVQYKLGRLNVALKYLARAYDLLQDPEVAAHYGEVLWKLGRQSDAKKIFEQASRAAPANDVLRETMRRLLISL